MPCLLLLLLGCVLVPASGFQCYVGEEGVASPASCPACTTVPCLCVTASLLAEPRLQQPGQGESRLPTYSQTFLAGSVA